jgi:hypothetical protein
MMRGLGLNIAVIVYTHKESVLNRAVGQEGFEEFRERLSKCVWRYEDVTFQETIQKVQGRVVELQRFYDEVGLLANRRLGSMDDVREAKNQLNSVGRQYLNVIGDQQRTFVEEALAKIDEYTRKQEQDAIRWLKEQETQYAARADLPALRGRLDNPPSFLPDRVRKRLDTLIQSVDQCLDENAVERIESYFLRIKDQSTRRKCLARLQKLLQEKAE